MGTHTTHTMESNQTNMQRKLARKQREAVPTAPRQPPRTSAGQRAASAAAAGRHQPQAQCQVGTAAQLTHAAGCAVADADGQSGSAAEGSVARGSRGRLWYEGPRVDRALQSPLGTPRGRMLSTAITP